MERLILLLAGEQRRLAGVGGSGSILVQRIRHLGQNESLVGIEGSAQCHIQQAVLRAGAGHVQRFVKALAQHAAEGERAAQIQDIALDGTALCKACNGLVDHGLINAGSNVLGAGTLIDQGLHVALGKHAAAGRNGVGALCVLCCLVHLVGTHFQQGGHLVDEGTGAAGTAAVHADLGAVGQEQDLCVLAAQLDHAVGGGHKPLDCHTCNVTANFAKESNSGLYFNDYFEFEGCVNYYMDNPVIAGTMGKTGRQFVLDNFKWDVIVKRFLDFFES